MSYFNANEKYLAGEWRGEEPAQPAPAAPAPPPAQKQTRGHFSADDRYLNGVGEISGAAVPPPVAELVTATAPALEVAQPIAAPPLPRPDDGPGCPQTGCGAPLRVSAAGLLCCSYCGAAAVLRGDGAAVPVEALLYGACSCCRPRRPLIRAGDYLLCSGKPDGPHYPLPADAGSRTTPQANDTQQPELVWDTIDRALRDNSAVLGTHGLFLRN